MPQCPIEKGLFSFLPHNHNLRGALKGKVESEDKEKKSPKTIVITEYHLRYLTVFTGCSYHPILYVYSVHLLASTAMP